jgi:hypothetical protein
MDDAFWDRRTTFWDEEEPARPKTAAPKTAARPKRRSGVSRRSRRIRTLSRRSKIATLCALGSSAALFAVAFSGLASNDAARDSKAGSAAEAAGTAQSRDGSHPRVPTLGPLTDATPVASVTDAPSGAASTPTAVPPPSAAPAAHAPGGAGNASSPTPAAAAAPAPAAVSAPASAPAPTPPTPPPPSPVPTTSPVATPPQPPPSCTIGLLGTCVVGGGGVLP